MPRYAVFVDGGYVRPTLKAFGPPIPTISYEKLGAKFQGQDELLRMYYYDCAPFQSNSPTLDEKTRKAAFDQFKNKLEALPRTEVKLGRLRRSLE